VVRDHAALRLHALFPTTTVTCSLGSLAAGDNVVKVLGVSWSDTGDQTVRATATATGPADPDLTDNTETATTTVS
jgi:hypothetical protein